MAREYLNFSSSVYNHVNCMQKIHYYLAEEDQKGEGGDGGPSAREAGIWLHKLLEQYYEDDLFVPPFDCFQGRERAAFYRVAEEVDKVRSQIVDCEGEFVKEDGDFRCKGIIDLVLNDGTIVDYKFPGKKWNDYKFADYVFHQAYIYFYLLEPHVKKLEYWVCPVSNPNDYKVWTVEYDSELVRQNLSIWKAVDQEIKASIKFPHMTEPRPEKLKCRWCYWNHICPHSYIERT